MKILAFLGISALALAESPLMGDVHHSGSGCATKLQTVFISDAGRQIYLGFPDYQASMDGEQDCIVVLPLRPASNQELAIEFVRVKAISEQAAQEHSYFESRTRLAGLASPPLRWHLEDEQEGERSAVLANEPKDLIWSGCGLSANLRLHTRAVSSGARFKIQSLRVRVVSRNC